MCVTTVAFEKIALLFRLHAFSNDFQAEVIGHPDDGADDRRIVDLDLVEEFKLTERQRLTQFVDQSGTCHLPLTTSIREAEKSTKMHGVTNPHLIPWIYALFNPCLQGPVLCV